MKFGSLLSYLEDGIPDQVVIGAERNPHVFSHF